MGFGSLRTLTLDTNFSIFGVDATVRPLDGPTVSARLIWMTDTTEDSPGGTQFPRKEGRRAVALRRSEVAAMPRGTVITAPEATGGEARTWKIDGPVVLEAEHWRVFVVPHEQH